MGVFEEDRLKRLALEWADEARVTQPHVVARETRTQVWQRCLTLLREGRRRGLTDDTDLYGFVMLSLAVGVEFFGAPPIRAVLESTSVVSGRKMVVIIDAMLQCSRRRDAHVAA